VTNTGVYAMTKYTSKMGFKNNYDQF